LTIWRLFCYIRIMTRCSIKRCGNEAVIKGLCRKHYMRLRRNGDATVTKTPGPKPRADPLDELGSVWIQREFMTAAAILIMAAKL
jgi:hypothetical protein